MIYEYELFDVHRCVIPVQADNPEKADKIFKEWVASVDGCIELANLLDNGYLGRSTLIHTKSESTYPVDDILLPKEGDRPKFVKPLYNIHIHYENGHKTHKCELTLEQMTEYLNTISAEYILFPDPNYTYSKYIDVNDDGGITNMWFYATLKEDL